MVESSEGRGCGEREGGRVNNHEKVCCVTCVYDCGLPFLLLNRIDMRKEGNNTAALSHRKDAWIDDSPPTPID